MDFNRTILELKHPPKTKKAVKFFGIRKNLTACNNNQKLIF